MNRLRHLIELAGLLAIGVGCWQVYRPLAWIFGGVALLLLAFCWWALRE